MVAPASCPYLVLVVPLLSKTGAYRDFTDRLVVVDCPESVLVEPTMSRRQLSRTEVERILVAQTTREVRLATTVDAIETDAEFNSRPIDADRLHERYLERAQAERSNPKRAE